MKLWIPVIWLGAAFLLLFTIAEILYRRSGVKAEYTRKTVHIGTGLLTLLFPLYLEETWQVALLCGSFLLILLASLKFGWLPSINKVDRKTAGSWLYPIVVILTFLFYRNREAHPSLNFGALYYFYLPLLLLAICDPAAALTGGYVKRKGLTKVAGKTIAGSIAFFITAILICVFLAFAFRKQPFISPIILSCLTIAFVSMVAERFSSNGWDNLTIPGSAMLCLYLIDLIG